VRMPGRPAFTAHRHGDIAGQRPVPRRVAAGAYSRFMTLLARMLGFGLDVLQALPRRGRFSAALAVALSLSIWLWPELLIEIALLRAEPILEAVT
jgi:hypothetical protein